MFRRRQQQQQQQQQPQEPQEPQNMQSTNNRQDGNGKEQWYFSNPSEDKRREELRRAAADDLQKHLDQQQGNNRRRGRAAVQSGSNSIAENPITGQPLGGGQTQAKDDNRRVSNETQVNNGQSDSQRNNYQYQQPVMTGNPGNFAQNYLPPAENPGKAPLEDDDRYFIRRLKAAFDRENVNGSINNLPAGIQPPSAAINPYLWMRAPPIYPVQVPVWPTAPGDQSMMPSPNYLPPLSSNVRVSTGDNQLRSESPPQRSRSFRSQSPVNMSAAEKKQHYMKELGIH